MSEQAERLVERQQTFTGALLRVYRDEVALPDGQRAVREVVAHPGAAAVVALQDDGRCLLVRQWRHAVGRAVWELCAGTRDPGEDPEATARRELTEETGYSASRWRRLGEGAVSPGYSDEIVHLYLAQGLSAGATSPDVDENVCTGMFTQAEVHELVLNGETDLKTVAGLCLAGWLSTELCG